MARLKVFFPKTHGVSRVDDAVGRQQAVAIVSILRQAAGGALVSGLCREYRMMKLPGNGLLPNHEYLYWSKLNSCPISAMFQG